MALNLIKFSQFAAGSLSNKGYIVGVTSLSGGTNFQQPETNVWATAGRPGTPYTGVLGYNTDLSQYEYWNGAAWVQLAAGGSGTVNLGGAGQIAYYATNGTAVSGTNSLPNTVTLQGITNGTVATAGEVGELIFSVISSASAVGMTSGVFQNITSIDLTPGDWDIWGSVSLEDTSSGGNIANILAGISSVSASVGDHAVTTFITSQTFQFGELSFPVPSIPFNITVPTTYYLVAYGLISAGALYGCGSIYARRRR